MRFERFSDIELYIERYNIVFTRDEILDMSQDKYDALKIGLELLDYAFETEDR